MKFRLIQDPFTEDFSIQYLTSSKWNRKEWINAFFAQFNNIKQRYSKYEEKLARADFKHLCIKLQRNRNPLVLEEQEI